MIGLLRRLLPIGSSSGASAAAGSEGDQATGTEFERRIEAARRRLKAAIPSRED